MQLIKIITITTLATAVIAATVSTADAQRNHFAGARQGPSRIGVKSPGGSTVRAVKKGDSFIKLGSPARETAETLTKDMKHSISSNTVPALSIFPLGKAKFTLRGELTGVGESGMVNMIGLFPVSAHLGKDSADLWARTNRYNVVVKHADGTKEILEKVKSTGHVTWTVLKLSLKKPGKTKVQVWPDGSDGVHGYSGREFVINWNGM